MRGERGQSIIFAVVGMLILAVLGVVFASLLATGTRMAVGQVHGVQAYYAAEAGLEVALRWLVDNPNWASNGARPNTGPDGDVPATFSTPYGPAQLTVTTTYPTAYTAIITATASLRDARRTIRANVHR